MAGELRVNANFTGLTCYAMLFDRNSQVWDTTGTPAFEAYVTAQIANYDIALTEQGTASKRYVGDFPAASAGYYDLEFYIRDGASPAETDELIGTESGYWSGSTWTPVTSASIIADAVCDEALSGHTTAGTVGKAISDIVEDTNELQGNQGDWATATSVTVSDKTGFKLAADGLDSITATTPTGVATTFTQKMNQLWARFFGRVTKDSDEIKTYRSDGTTVATTQTYTSSGDDDDIGAAT